MPKTEDLFKKLDAFAWWQVKHHKLKGANVHTCTIQSPTSKSDYFSATSTVSTELAIEEALSAAGKASS